MSFCCLYKGCTTSRGPQVYLGFIKSWFIARYRAQIKFPPYSVPTTLLPPLPWFGRLGQRQGLHKLDLVHNKHFWVLFITPEEGANICVIISALTRSPTVSHPSMILTQSLNQSTSNCESCKQQLQIEIWSNAYVLGSISHLLN